MYKIIIGRIGEMEIPEFIEYYQPGVFEQVQTAKKNIIRKFEEQGYNSKDVVFN